MNVGTLPSRQQNYRIMLPPAIVITYLSTIWLCLLWTSKSLKMLIGFIMSKHWCYVQSVRLSRLLPRTLVTSVCFCFVFVDSVVFCLRQHFLHEHSRHSVTFISPLILWWNTCRLNVSMKCKIISLFFKSRKIKRTCNNSNIKQL